MIFKILFHSYPFLLALILLWRFVLPLNIGSKKKFLLGLFLIISASKGYVYFFTGGKLYEPNLGKIFSFITNTLSFICIFLFFCVFARDLINLFYKPIKLKLHINLISTRSPFIAAIFFSLSFTIALIGTTNGFLAPIVTHKVIYLKDLPKKAENFTIAHLSDLHISPAVSLSDVQNWVKITNSTNPDLIVITGDFVDGGVLELYEKAQELFKLQAKYGVYAVSGNHEYYSGYKEWIEFLGKGMIFLENTSTTITSNDGQKLFYLSGISDKNASRFHQNGPDFKKALENTDKKLPIIMLSHQPTEAFFIKDKISLMLSGHTHGGQAPILNLLVGNANLGLTKGLYQLGDTQVFVSSGTRQWMGFPFRICTPSEIAIIKLKKSK